MTQDALISFGQRLKSNRESMGLTAQDAASHLNLSPRFIHLLENEDLQQSTLPPIYLRGYLRSYARLLKIAETDITSALEQLAPTPAILTAAPTTTDTLPTTAAILENNPAYVRAGTYIVSFMLLTSVATWWYMHNSTPAPAVIALNPPALVAESNTNTAITSIASNAITAASNSDNASALTAANPSSTQHQLALASTQKASSALSSHQQGNARHHEEDEESDEQE